MNWFITIFLSIILVSCSVAKEDKSFSNAIRLFFGTYEAPKTLKLSIKGQLKDAKGKVMANTLLSQSTGINTGLALRGTDKVLRCADYALKSQQLQCIKIIKLKNLAKKASDSCYIIYTGMPGYLKEKQIAKFSNIASDKEI
ncbi:MAG: hypothetical protein KDK45_19755, partial [Leptospiraceae bacterium]|nr:hypothetical protein [Leptospiraceae bacterium]